MTSPWALPGYDVQALLADGADGQVWRGIERATGRPVALRRLRLASDPAGLRQAAALLRSLDTPYVVRLHEVVEEAEGTVLVLDLAEGGSLAALLARRGMLDPGEVVTIAVPVAQALAVAHDRGLVHGDVTPSAVLLTADGMPLLDGLGTWRHEEGHEAGDHTDPALAVGGPATGASDVWSLAAVCHSMLTGRPPGPGADSPVRLDVAAPDLVEAVEAALVLDPALRPDAGAFADALLQAHGAEPVRFPGARAAPPGHGRHGAAGTEWAAGTARAARSGPRHAAAPSGGRRTRTLPRRVRRLPPWLAAGSGAAVLLVGAAAVGVAWGQADGEAPPAPAPVLTAPPAPPSTAPPPPPPSPSPAGMAGPLWAEVLDGLDAARADAFATADAARLDAVYAPGAPGLAADRALVERLAGTGRTAGGVRHDVRAVEVLEAHDDRARLRVVDVLASYEVRDAAGAVTETVPARGETAHHVELASTPQGWRLVQVAPA